MSTSSLSEQRLTEIEAAVSRLQRRLANLPPAPDWVALKDEPAFEEILAFGRALRAVDHLPEDPEAPV